MDEQRTFTQRAGIVVALVTAVLVVGWLILNIIDVLLLVFAGFLLAIFLSALVTFVEEHTPLSYRWAYGIVILGIAILIGIIGYTSAPVIGTQIRELQSTLPEAIDRLRETVADWPLSERMLEQAPDAQDVLLDQGMLGRVSSVFSVTFGFITGFVIVLFIGLYGAFHPSLYREGLIHLVPLYKRQRAREILKKLVMALRQWLLGQVTEMLIIGISTTIVLWLLGIPLALLLGLIAAFLTFIPNIGPILSAVPAVLLGLIQSPTKALYVILAYVIIQTIESYFITPVVQRRMVELPPVVTIVAQIALGVLWGFTGLLVATPLVVAVIVLTQMIYVNDILGDDMSVYGDHHHDDDSKS